MRPHSNATTRDPHTQGTRVISKSQAIAAGTTLGQPAPATTALTPTHHHKAGTNTSVARCCTSTTNAQMYMYNMQRRRASDCALTLQPLVEHDEVRLQSFVARVGRVGTPVARWRNGAFLGRPAFQDLQNFLRRESKAVLRRGGGRHTRAGGTSNNAISRQPKRSALPEGTVAQAARASLSHAHQRRRHYRCYDNTTDGSLSDAIHGRASTRQPSAQPDRHTRHRYSRQVDGGTRCNASNTSLRAVTAID